MPSLRVSSFASALIATGSLCLYAVAAVQKWPTHRPAAALGFASATMVSVALYCTDLCLRRIADAERQILAKAEHVKDEAVDLVSRQMEAMHRSLMVTIEQYGDGRAIDAAVAVERRHRVGEVTRSNESRGSNVTSIHSR